MGKHEASVSSVYKVILLLGIVSLLGDVIYEGSRGFIPDYLAFLGASALVVGIVGGLGEFIGYFIRVISGFLADMTKAYWLFIFLGYGLIAAIPLLGFSHIWHVAALLVILERLGKALRTPSRDIILSAIASKVGTGKAFGIHELMDQTGAVLGPLIVSTLMFTSGNCYNYTFLALFLPYALLIFSLLIVYGKIGKINYEMLEKSSDIQTSGLSRGFLIYSLAVALNTLGSVSAMLILYRASEFFDPWMVPLVYLMIQGVDAAVAFAAGYTYDRYGVKILYIPFALSIIPSILTLTANTSLTVLAAAAVFGLVLGMQESIYRAAVADLVPLPSRGKAYGIFNTLYGIGFLIGGAVFGFFLDIKGIIMVAVIYTLVIQFSALSLLSSVKQ